MGKMKRLTGWYRISNQDIGDTLVGVHDQQAFHRLALIEDILGDEYDLDWLKDVVERAKNNKTVYGTVYKNGRIVF